MNQIGWGREEYSIISYATNGNAVISKAAGKDSVAVGTATSSGQLDYLDSALIDQHQVSDFCWGAKCERDGTVLAVVVSAFALTSMVTAAGAQVKPSAWGSTLS